MNATELQPTDDVVPQAELFRDVFGCDSDDCNWHSGAIERGWIQVCDGEWRREPDGRWRLHVDPHRVDAEPST